MHKKVYSSPDAELISYKIKDVLAGSAPKPTEEYVFPIFKPEDEVEGDGLAEQINP